MGQPILTETWTHRGRSSSAARMTDHHHHFVGPPPPSRNRPAPAWPASSRPNERSRTTPWSLSVMERGLRTKGRKAIVAKSGLPTTSFINAAMSRLLKDQLRQIIAQVHLHISSAPQAATFSYAKSTSRVLCGASPFNSGFYAGFKITDTVLLPRLNTYFMLAAWRKLTLD